ncbi:MAG: hypothetical protein U1E05_25030, partial [Patescibacteria group bacterium]|nr:hypothetical protein [Patescibacteria group bacterium]
EVFLDATRTSTLGHGAGGGLGGAGWGGDAAGLGGGVTVATLFLAIDANLLRMLRGPMVRTQRSVVLVTG